MSIRPRKGENTTLRLSDTKVNTMAEQPTVAPVAEPKVTTEAPVVEAPKEPTVKEALDGKPKDEPRMVPEAALIEIKKENKALAKDLKALQKRIEEGSTKREVSG